MWYRYDFPSNARAFIIQNVLDRWTVHERRDIIQYEMGYNKDGDFVLTSVGSLYHIKTIYYEDGRIPQSNVVHVHPTRW